MLSNKNRKVLAKRKRFTYKNLKFRRNRLLEDMVSRVKAYFNLYGLFGVNLKFVIFVLKS